MVRKRNVHVHEAILGIVLFTCLMFRAEKITLFISAISIIAYTVIILFLLKDRLLLKYLGTFISTGFLMVGVFVCDAMNLWLSEIESITYYCGSFNILAFYYWLFFLLLRRIDPYYEKHTKRKFTNVKIGTTSLTKWAIKYGKIIIFVFGLGLFLSVARHPFFIYGVTNRFEYAQTYVSRWLNLLRVFPPILVPLVLIPTIESPKLSLRLFFRNVVAPYMPYFLFLIWTGNKYGAYVEIIVFALVPLIVFGKIKIRIRSILKYGILSFSLVLILLFLYYHLQGLNFFNALYQIYLRIGCQGELWWKTVKTVAQQGPNVNEFQKEIMYQWQAIVSEASVKKYGVYHLMDLLGRASIVQQYGTIGTRFAASGMELPFYCFGYLSFLRLLIICPITAWINNMYLNAVKERRIFTAIISARIFVLLTSALSQGDWYAFFSTVPLLFVLMLVFIELWNHRGSGVKKHQLSTKTDVLT